MPLNIFEPRYLAMVDDTRAGRHRLIGMIQPDIRTARTRPADAVSRRLRRPHYPARRIRRGRISSNSPASRASRWSRTHRADDIPAMARWISFPTFDDFVPRKGENAVDRTALLEVLTDFLKRQQSESRLGRHRERPKRSAGQRAGR